MPGFFLLYPDLRKEFRNVNEATDFYVQRIALNYKRDLYVYGRRPIATIVKAE